MTQGREGGREGRERGREGERQRERQRPTTEGGEREREREGGGEREAYYLFFVASVGMALNLLVIITTFIRRNLRK